MLNLPYGQRPALTLQSAKLEALLSPRQTCVRPGYARPIYGCKPPLFPCAAVPCVALTGISPSDQERAQSDDARPKRHGVQQTGELVGH
jgi:hypothetical protein